MKLHLAIHNLVLEVLYKCIILFFNIMRNKSANVTLFSGTGLVFLIGGPSSNAGTLYARNPTTGIYGPVCDDNFAIPDVRLMNIILVLLN